MLELLLRGRFAFLTATCGLAGLKARLVISILLWMLPFGLFRLFLRPFFTNATFFHLVFITIFVFIKALFKGLVTLPLSISDAILIQERFDLAGGFMIVSCSPGSLEDLLAFSSLLLNL